MYHQQLVRKIPKQKRYKLTFLMSGWFDVVFIFQMCPAVISSKIHFGRQIYSNKRADDFFLLYTLMKAAKMSIFASHALNTVFVNLCVWGLKSV